MLRSLFVVAAVCCANTATAFAPAAPMALGAQPRARAHGLARKQFRPAVLPALRMVDQPDQVIDFGKVGFSEAENQMRSLVFQPEGGEVEPESRCRVNWDIKLEQALNDHINVEYTASTRTMRSSPTSTATLW